jgi:hypothetical protein
MDEPVKRHAPFEEQALLEELERVREQIQQARLQRRAVQDEFKRFVRGFKEPTDPGNATTGDGPPGESAIHRPAALKEPEAEPNKPVTPEGPQLPPALAGLMSAAPASTTAQEVTSQHPMHEPARAAAPRAQPWTRVLAGGAVILLAGVAVTISMRNDASEPPPSSDPPQAAQPAMPAPEPRPADGAPASRESEIVTIRRVWMRVLVDGERVLEREVPADTRVPLSAQKTILIRTGDAGAVRLSIRGDDQGFLGREGEVLTRSFTMPPGR